jgi:hypothetical protein
LKLAPHVELIAGRQRDERLLVRGAGSLERDALPLGRRPQCWLRPWQSETERGSGIDEVHAHGLCLI